MSLGLGGGPGIGVGGVIHTTGGEVILSGAHVDFEAIAEAESEMTHARHTREAAGIDVMRDEEAAAGGGAARSARSDGAAGAGAVAGTGAGVGPVKPGHGHGHGHGHGTDAGAAAGAGSAGSAGHSTVGRGQAVPSSPIFQPALEALANTWYQHSPPPHQHTTPVRWRRRQIAPFR
jgi:hypothetical protein